jgi:hypothetical protein
MAVHSIHLPAIYGDTPAVYHKAVVFVVEACGQMDS